MDPLDDAHLPPARVALIGGAGMAAAMGIGRFAFTPLLPLMQGAQHLSLAHGTWLALANYLGYLVGAVLGFVVPPKPGAAARVGLAVVALVTVGMAVTDALAAWLVLRFAAGVASAFVMIGVAGWALARLAAAGRGTWSGWVFGSVGFGITIAGAVAFASGALTGDPRPAWLALGAASAVVAATTWRALRREATPSGGAVASAAPIDRDGWVLVACYGAGGFGYIVPATFLPAVARALVDDPAVFGWIWPAFGIASAIGVIGVSTRLHRIPPRIVCGAAMLVMAVGTAAPVIRMTIGGLLVSAACVGGTFILVTLAGLQEARRLARGSPARAIAAMTASFALGQLAGPLLARPGAAAVATMRVPCLVATIALVIGGTVLLLRRTGVAASSSAPSADP